MKLILYSAPDCHLCDLAKVVIDNVVQSQELSALKHEVCDLTIEMVNVRQSIDLKRRYGLRIPVLALNFGDAGSELGWPFDEGDFLQWYSESSQ